MLLLFGYMIALIFIKWGTDYSKNTAKAPSIITILMNLALKGGSVDGKLLTKNICHRLEMFYLEDYSITEISHGSTKISPSISVHSPANNILPAFSHAHHIIAE